MTPTRIAFCIIVAIFVVAEVARPTRVPAKKSAHALVVHSQAVPGAGSYASLDPNLLDDLPRIHPDAAGDVRCSPQRDGSTRVFGTVWGDDGGSAVFLVSDAARLGAEATIFGQTKRPHEFAIEITPHDLGSGEHRLHVALISGDERGFFLLPKTVAITVGRSARNSQDCRTLPNSA